MEFKIARGNAVGDLTEEMTLFGQEGFHAYGNVIPSVNTKRVFWGMVKSGGLIEGSKKKCVPEYYYVREDSILGMEKSVNAVMEEGFHLVGEMFEWSNYFHCVLERYGKK